MIRHSAMRMSVAAVIFAACTPVMAADPVEVGIGGTVQLYGQLTPAVLSFDDGQVNTNQLVDNSNSISRLGVWYVRPIRRGTLNANFEFSFGLRPSGQINQTSTSVFFDETRRNIRKAEVIWITDHIGTFYLGQGSMASDNVAIQDLSGTSIVSNVGISDTAGSFFLRSTTGALSSIIVSAAFPSFDGGRGVRVRYDSPSFRGLVLSTSVGQKVLTESGETNDSDVTIRYGWDGRLFRVEAAGGLLAVNRDVLEDSLTTIGSISARHKPTGLTFTASAGKRDTTGSYTFLKLGYQVNWLRVGPSTISVDHYSGSHMVTGGSRSSSYGFAFIQKFDNPRVEGYFAYRDYDYADQSATRYEKARSVLFGARWKF